MGGSVLTPSCPDLVSRLHKKLVDPSTSLPEKYRVMFSLRNVEGELANEALLQGGCCLCWWDARVSRPTLQQPQEGRMHA